MRQEVECAAQFLTSLVRRGTGNAAQADMFCEKLCEILTQRYKNHWHVEQPQRGSAYRCIRNDRRLDPLISEAAAAAHLTDVVCRLLPCELTLWVDPRDVSYRIGEDGSICDLDIALSENDLSSSESSSDELENSSYAFYVAPQRVSPVFVSKSMKYTHSHRIQHLACYTNKHSSASTTSAAFVVRPNRPRVYYSHSPPAYSPVRTYSAPLVSSVAS